MLNPSGRTPYPGKYFNKIQCFCFEEQKLRAGERVDMPVFFYIDPEFASDPTMWNVDEITLGYTFFKVEEQESEEATRALIEEAKRKAIEHAGAVAAPVHGTRTARA